MSFLSSASIKKAINDHQIIVKPKLEERQYGQCSIDLRLADKIKRHKRPFLGRFTKEFDLRSNKNDSIENDFISVIKEDEGFIIKPNEMIIATTIESIRLPNNMFGFLTGRSSLSRIGLEIQLTQDLKPPGHEGVVLLQIRNNSTIPLRLFPGMRIAQLMIGLLDLEKEECVGYHESPHSKFKEDNDPLSFNWKKDPELADKEIIVKKFDWTNFLNLLLIASLIITAGFFISSNIKEIFSNPWITMAVLVFVATGITRLIMYLRS